MCQQMILQKTYKFRRHLELPEVMHRLHGVQNIAGCHHVLRMDTVQRGVLACLQLYCPAIVIKKVIIICYSAGIE